MSWKFILLLSILITIKVSARKGEFNCKRASKFLDRCRRNGYEIEDCEVGNGKLSRRQIRRCPRLLKKFPKMCDEYQCNRKKPEDGWMTVDLQPKNAVLVEDDGEMVSKFMIYSEPVAYENSKTMVEYVVKFLKPIDTVLISLSPTVQLLNDKDEVMTYMYNRLMYQKWGDTINLMGWVSMFTYEGDPENNSKVRCRKNDGFATSPTDEGPAVRFFPDEIRYEAKYSGDRTLTLDFEELGGCDEANDLYKETLKSAKKIRFLFEAVGTEYLREYVEFKYRFVNRPE